MILGRKPREEWKAQASNYKILHPTMHTTLCKTPSGEPQYLQIAWQFSKTLITERLVEHGAPQNMRQATAFANCAALS